MLRGKTALVAESAFGIGAKIAKRFAYEGAHVLLVSEYSSDLAAVYDEIKVLGGSATITQTDIKKMESIGELCVSVSNIFKCLDILVGGIFQFSGVNLLIDYTESNWKNAIDANLNNNWRLLKAFDPLLKASNAGRVIMNVCDYKAGDASFCGVDLIAELSLERLLEIYAKETEHTNIKANLVSLANAELVKEQAKVDVIAAFGDVTDVFVQLSSENCKFTGKKHYAQY